MKDWGTIILQKRRCQTGHSGILNSMFGQFVFCWASLSTCLNLTTHTHSSATVQCASKGNTSQDPQKVWYLLYIAITVQWQTPPIMFSTNMWLPLCQIRESGYCCGTSFKNCIHRAHHWTAVAVTIKWRGLRRKAFAWPGLWLKRHPKHGKVDTRLILWYTEQVPKRSLEVGLLESKVMFPGFKKNEPDQQNGVLTVKSKVWLLMLPWWRPRSLPLDCPVYWRRGGVLTWYKKIPVAYFMRGLLVALWLFAGKLALTTWCATCSLFKFHLSWQNTHENIWLNLTLMRTTMHVDVQTKRHTEIFWLEPTTQMRIFDANFSSISI